MSTTEINAALGNAVYAIVHRANKMSESQAVRVGEWVAEAATEYNRVCKALLRAERAMQKLEECADTHQKAW